MSHCLRARSRSRFALCPDLVCAQEIRRVLRHSQGPAALGQGCVCCDCWKCSLISSLTRCAFQPTRARSCVWLRLVSPALSPVPSVRTPAFSEPTLMLVCVASWQLAKCAPASASTSCRSVSFLRLSRLLERVCSPAMRVQAPAVWRRRSRRSSRRVATWRTTAWM